VQILSTAYVSLLQYKTIAKRFLVSEILGNSGSDYV
jgi:hypothetical protein